MVEKYYKTYYSISNTYLIYVTSDKSVIQNIPTSIEIPLGGCSLPYKIEIDNGPIDDVDISI